LHQALQAVFGVGRMAALALFQMDQHHHSATSVVGLCLHFLQVPPFSPPSTFSLCGAATHDGSVARFKHTLDPLHPDAVVGAPFPSG
jgi:hypothetical protein